MISRFIVGYDGSDLAREAFAYSTMLAKRIGAAVHAVYVVEPQVANVLAGDPSVLVDPMMPPIILTETADAAFQAERQRATLMLDELEDTCDQLEVPFTSEVVRGSLMDTLAALSHPTDMLALGLKGRFRRSGVGSSTRLLVTHSKCPVLVASGPLATVNRILTPYDGTVGSTRALMVARQLAKDAAWPLTVLALARDNMSLDEAQDWSQQLAEEAQVISLSKTLGSEAELIERTVGSDPYALLVMGAYADSWFKDLFTGSTTNHVLSHLKAPMILVPKPLES